jgi:hypothetical protein
MKVLIIFILLSFTAISQGRFIVNGTNLKVVTTGSVKIVLNDYNYLNQATSLISVGGDWNFVGSTNQNITGINQFQSLTINKTGGEVSLDNDIIVLGDVTMTNGNINLNGKILDLSTTGSLINESDVNKVYSTSSTSYVKVIRTIGGSTTINPGNIGLSLVTTNALGSTEIRRRNEIVDVGSSNMSINRVYSVFPSTNNGSLNATLNVNYFNSELNGLDENSLVTYRRPSSSSPWINKGGTNIQTTLVGGGTGIIQNLNWMEFSEVTLATDANPLPIELLNFEVICYGNNVRALWTTASEYNNDYFTLERSKDGQTWEVIGNIPGATNSTMSINYSYEDSKPYRGIGYYRLSQTDYNGEIKTFNTESTDCTPDYSGLISLYPNPSNDVFIILLDKSLLNLNKSVKIYDFTGAIIQKFEKITSDLEINCSKWSSGVYYVNIDNLFVKLVKK